MNELHGSFVLLPFPSLIMLSRYSFYIKESAYKLELLRAHTLCTHVNAAAFVPFVMAIMQLLSDWIQLSLMYSSYVHVGFRPPIPTFW